MKKIVKNIFPAIYLVVIAFSAASCNKTQAAPAAAPGQPVDLTYAAIQRLRPLSTATHSRISSLTPSEASSDADRAATTVLASVRCRLQSVQQQVRV